MYGNYGPPPPQPPPPQQWTHREQKLFESGLAMYLDGTAEGWRMIAALVPGRSVEEVRARYESLVRDVEAIDSGRVDSPPYSDDRLEAAPAVAEAAAGTGTGTGASSSRAPRVAAPAEERKKGTPWTEDEHRRFLEGLEKYGKGDWRSISRNAVVSRTPTRVASHARNTFLDKARIRKTRRGPAFMT